jgi:hypothetical protein
MNYTTEIDIAKNTKRKWLIINFAKTWKSPKKKKKVF